MIVEERGATYGQVFAQPAFRALFVARGLGTAADSLRIFALSAYVFGRTGSPLLSAVAFGAGFLPQIVGGLLFGALPDRVRPRRLAVSGYLVSAAMALIIAVADLPAAASLALVALIACGTPVFAGGTGRLAAQLLTGDAYVLGRSILSVASSGAQLTGLAIGGALVAVAGPHRALLIAAGGNGLAAVIARFRLPDLPAGNGAAGSAVRDSLTGATAMWADRQLRNLLLANWLPPACVAGAEALLVPYAAGRSFGPGAGGVLLAALPAGMLAGNLIVGRWIRPRMRERVAPALVGLMGSPLMILLDRPPLVVTAGLLVLTGTGFAYSLGLQRRLLHATPRERQGQLFALLSTGLMALQGVGPLVFGAVAQIAGPGAAIAAAGACTVAGAMLAKPPIVDLCGSRRGRHPARMEPRDVRRP
jgi:predicted MFS family arabinose efflux permease